MSTIVLATDLTDVSTAAVGRAIDLAGRLCARLLIVHVLDQGRLSGRGSHERVDQARAEREPLLIELVRQARAEGVDAEFLMWAGTASEGIAEAASSEGAEIIVVGTRRRRGAGRIDPGVGLRPTHPDHEAAGARGAIGGGQHRESVAGLIASRRD